MKIDKIMRSAVGKFERIDKLDGLELTVKICNERFQDALARGDDAAMDFWQAATKRYENAHALECAIGACGVMLMYGISDANGHSYKRNIEEARGLFSTSDLVLDVLADTEVVEYNGNKPGTALGYELGDVN